MNNVVEKCCSRCKQVQPIENFAMKTLRRGDAKGIAGLARKTSAEPIISETRKRVRHARLPERQVFSRGFVRWSLKI